MKKRAMKKWIPVSIYCDHCKWWERLWFPVTDEMYENLDMYINPEQAKKDFDRLRNHPYKHKREECQFKDVCEDDCSQCQEMVSYCKYLNYVEYGQYPLGDSCKVCGIRDSWEDE